MGRPRAVAAAALLALAAGGAGLLLAQEVEVPDGLPSLAGTWTGKFSRKSSGLNTSVEGAKLKADCTLDIEQTGFSLLATVTVQAPDGEFEYYLHGQVGNGLFWLQGDTTGFGTPLQMVGRASGAPGALRMKASGVGATTESVLAVTLQAKQTPL